MEIRCLAAIPAGPKEGRVEGLGMFGVLGLGFRDVWGVGCRVSEQV